MSRRLAAYRSRGEVYFSGTVRGELSAKQNPQVKVRFGCRDASFYHPDTKQTLEHVHLAGTFTNGAQATARQAVLELKDVRGRLRGRPFSGSLRYANLLDPTITLHVRADLDVADALRFYPTPVIRQASGQAKLDIKLNGNVRALRRNPGRAAAQASGEMVLRNVSLKLRDLAPALSGLNGSFLLRRNDVAVTNFSGRLGQSDFLLSGMFRNALGWLLVPNQALLVEADVSSRLLNLNELLSTPEAAGAVSAGSKVGAAETNGYTFKLPANLALDLEASVAQLRFRRLRARGARGKVRLQQQVLSTPGVTLVAAGGRFDVRGSLDARQPTVVQAHTVASCQQVPLDSLFYVFENFGQAFITARHLRGELTAKADADLFFTPQLRPLTERLEAEVHATVRRGELNNFEPMQKLSMVASREQLRHLRFDELTNTVYIQSGTVYVPSMDIRSNVRAASRITVTGTHTFDQQMDYHLAIPLLPGLRRPVFKTTDGGIATSNGPELLLHVWGDEANFRVGYDRERAQARRNGPAAAPSAETKAPATSSPAPAPPPRLRDVLKTPIKPAEKKPAIPQPGEYFEF
ncbi:AsmA-like C-terminal region-containing protein [Hymenobacter koreensis]